MAKKIKPLSRELQWKCDFPALMEEITNISADKKFGILFQPINLMKQIMVEVADRAIKLNDPILNELMCDLRLYETPNPGTKEYTALMKTVRLAAHKQKLKESKSKK